MSRLGRLVFWIVLFTNVLLCNVIGDNFISIMFWFQSAVFIVMRVRKIGLVGQWYNLELCINKKQQQTYLELIDWFKNYKAILYASFQYFFPWKKLSRMWRHASSLLADLWELLCILWQIVRAYLGFVCFSFYICFKSLFYW